MVDRLHEYVENEDGPDCYCGSPTVVKIVDGAAILLCFFHSSEDGMYTVLPPQDGEHPMTEENWQQLLANNKRDEEDDEQPGPEC